MDNSHLGTHTSHQFNADLEQLRTHLLEMGGIVEEQVINAAQALETANSELAEKVLLIEQTVDQFEIDIDHESTLVLARRQPAASDLRMVLTVSRATRDLERMGDEAEKIAKMAIALNVKDNGSSNGYIELRHIASSVVEQVHLALDAFARFDADSALQVVKHDRIIDQEYTTTLRELITYMMEDPRSISRVMNVLWALRALERIGDHAENIAQHVIYLVHGMDIRHTPLAEVEAKLDKINK